MKILRREAFSGICIYRFPLHSQVNCATSTARTASRATLVASRSHDLSAGPYGTVRWARDVKCPHRLSSIFFSQLALYKGSYQSENPRERGTQSKPRRRKSPLDLRDPESARKGFGD